MYVMVQETKKKRYSENINNNYYAKKRIHEI